MKEFLLYKQHHFLDLLVSISFGVHFGYSSRREADSGDVSDPETLLKAAIVCGTSFFVAFLLSILLQYKVRRLPSFFWLVVIGPLFFGIGYRAMMYSEWLQNRPFSITAFVAQDGGQALGLALVHTIPFLFCILAARAIGCMATVIVTPINIGSKLR